MKELSIRIFLSFASFSGVLFFLFVWKKVGMPIFSADLITISNYPILSIYLKYTVLFAMVLWFAYLWLSFVRNYLPKISGTEEIIEIKPIEGSFLPVYIWLFVIALSFSDTLQPETITLLFVLFLFWAFLDWVSYFNPFWLLFWYRFYETKSSSGTVFTLITKKKDIKITNGKYVLDNLIRINNFTFLQK